MIRAREKNKVVHCERGEGAVGTDTVMVYPETRDVFTAQTSEQKPEEVRGQAIRYLGEQHCG